MRSFVCDLLVASMTVCLLCLVNQPQPSEGQRPSYCESTGSRCIKASDSACRLLPDGDYQACEGCTFYHSCVAGVINYSFRDCPLTNQGGQNGKLVWDDLLKRCEYTSPTCRGCNVNPSPTAAPTNLPPIIPPTTDCSKGFGCLPDTANACQGRPDGDYQSCSDCGKYISCINGGRCSSGARSCPPGWKWVITSSSQGYCTASSGTCNNCPISDCKNHQRRCLPETENTCAGQLDGDYQSCTSCYRYISCKNGVTWLNRPCPNDGGPWSWVITSMTQGYCHPTSQTCNQCPVEEKCTTGRGCVEESDTTCRGIRDGDYQSCRSCHVYISCRNDQTWTNRACPVGANGHQQNWTITSATQGYCTDVSATCNACPIVPSNPIPPGPVCRSTGVSCITADSGSCRGRADGHYQACEGCTIYHSCSGGVIWPNRDCPLTNREGQNGRLVWVQVTPTEGRCDYTSTTCSGSGCGASKTGKQRLFEEQWAAEQPEQDEDIETKMRAMNDAEDYNAPFEREFVDNNELSQDDYYRQALLLAARQAACNTGSKSGVQCIDGTPNSCYGLAAGDYQDCRKCGVFHTCDEASNVVTRACTDGTVWQSEKGVPGRGRCEWESTTCAECA